MNKVIQNSRPLSVAIYVRVSTEKQKEKYGLEAQIHLLKDYCKRMGWNYVFYNEGGISGETIIDRPKMIKLLQDVKNGKFDLVLVIELERLSRSERLSDWETIKEALREGGAKVATPSQILDPDDVDDDFILDIGGVLSKREKRVILKRMIRGKARAVAKGKTMGSALLPYGYCPDKKTGKIKIDNEEAQIINWIYDWCLKGMSCYKIAKKLTALGIPTRFKKKNWLMKGKITSGGWRTGRIHVMLTNKSYPGEPVEYHFTKYHKETVEVKFPQIITLKKFNSVQKQLKINAWMSPRNQKRFYLLKGLLYCQRCGRRLIGTGTERRGLYKCGGRLPLPYGCSCRLRSIGQEKIENIVWNKIVEVVTNSERIALALKKNKEKISSLYIETEEEIKEIDKLIKQKSQEENRLLDLYQKGTLPADLLEERISRIHKQHKELEEQKEQLLKNQKSRVVEKDRIVTIKNYMELIKEKIVEFNDEEKRKLCICLIRSIFVDYNERTREHLISIDFALPLLNAEKETLDWKNLWRELNEFPRNALFIQEEQNLHPSRSL